jgi:phosphodiesterase/alkaline phosphatase D-like protein
VDLGSGLHDAAVDFADKVGEAATEFFNSLPLSIQWLLNGIWGYGHPPPTDVGTGELAANGVAAGEVTESTAVLWARPLSSTEVRFQVALDEDFTQIVRELTVAATPGEPVHAPINGLSAGEQYFYRAPTASGGSAGARFNTAQDDGLHGLSFGVSGDWRGGNTPYAAVGNTDEASLDFFVQLGDTI